MVLKSGPGDFTNIMSLESLKLECVIHLIFNLCRFSNTALKKSRVYIYLIFNKFNQQILFIYLITYYLFAFRPWLSSLEIIIIHFLKKSSL